VYHFIYPSKDAYIYELNTNDEKNFGGDDTLVLKKDIDGNTLNGVSRILLKFDLTDISKSLSSGDITNPSYYLRLYEQKTSELSPSYQLNAYAMSSSWDDGTGYITQDPNNRDGVSWKRGDESFDNTLWTVGGIGSTEFSMASASKPLDSLHLHLDTGSRKAGGGVWYDEGGINMPGGNDIAAVVSQSFSYESPDVNMNVTDIVNKWLDGTRQNEGFIIKWDSNDSSMNSTSQSQEDSSDYTGDINFFSSNANSIYSPKIEVRWDDVDIDSPNKYSIDFGTHNVDPDKYVEVVDKQLISTEGTVACWSQITSSTGYRYFVSKWDNYASDKQYEWYLTALNNDTPAFTIASGSTHWNTNYHANSGTPLSVSTGSNAGLWYHLVGTFKFGEKTKLYINGELGATATTALPSGDSLDDGTAKILFGAYTQNGASSTPAGIRLNGVSIFDKQLSSTEVNTLYNGGVPHDLSNESNLVGYWKFNEGSGTDLADSSTNNNTGSIKNSPTWISGSTDSPDSGSFGISVGTGTKDFYAFMRNLRETYRETETPKFRVEVRERYQTKRVFTTKKSSTIYDANIRFNKGWYSIIDVETGAILIPFGDNSKLSQDTTSDYFKLNLNGFITNRLYRIILRLQLDDGRYRIFDDNFNFKVVS